MKEIDIIKTYYERIVAGDFPHAGEVPEGDGRTAAVDDTGCHGDGKNLLYFGYRVRAGVLRDVAYECEYCDVTMYVTAELVSGLIDGCRAADVARIGDEEIVDALGGRSRKILRQARTALRLLADALTAVEEPLD